MGINSHRITKANSSNADVATIAIPCSLVRTKLAVAGIAQPGTI
jgi:hypothetical protein